MRINIHKEVEIEPTIRTELLSSMFEIPAKTKLSVTLTGETDHDKRDYNIGLIVGPSGSGKTLLLNSIFDVPENHSWSRRSIIDDFPQMSSMDDISRVCQSVGFNTVPSWMRPYSVLSNGERFRADTALHLLSNRNPITIDEFTSVVDRQVAQFACFSIQKYVREKNKRLVVASCHYDIIDWLQPDWILEPGNPCRFTWRSLQPRPSITVAVSRVKYEAWNLFKDFHYMSQDLNKAARCFGLYVISSKCTDGLAVGLHDYDLPSPENRNNNNLGTSDGTRLPSSGHHGSSGDGEGNSRLLVRDGRCEIGNEYSANTAVRRGDSEDTSVSSSSIIQSTTLQPNETGELQFPIQRLEETRNNPHSSGIFGRPNRRLKILDRPNNETYRIASMCGCLYRPHPKVRDIVGFTRMVTLPDFQGLGLAFVLANTVASAYKALGKRLHSYPNHPAWIRSYQRSKNWMQVKEAGSFSPRRGSTSTVGGFGGRRCSVFQFIGDAMNVEDARRLINGED